MTTNVKATVLSDVTRRFRTIMAELDFRKGIILESESFVLEKTGGTFYDITITDGPQAAQYKSSGGQVEVFIDGKHVPLVGELEEGYTLTAEVRGQMGCLEATYQKPSLLEG